MGKLKVAIIINFLFLAYVLHLLVIQDDLSAILNVLFFSVITLVYFLTRRKYLQYSLILLGSLLCIWTPNTSSYYSIILILVLNLKCRYENSLLVGLLFLFAISFINSNHEIVLWSAISSLLVYTTFKIYLKFESKFSIMQVERDKYFNSLHELDILNKDRLDNERQVLELTKLEERNRIARDIHDSVGHLLSRSIVQIGALKVGADEQMCKQLDLLNSSLQEAMNSVRNSVHNLHDDSFDLRVELEKLCQMSSSPIQLRYHMNSKLDRTRIYHVLAIVKEAITNTQKHSNASMMKIQLYEQPKFYQLKCSDNGTQIQVMNDGIGLHNIKTRVDAMSGTMNINVENGFELFIMIPKEVKL